jgi:hypothetical protein
MKLGCVFQIPLGSSRQIRGASMLVSYPDYVIMCLAISSKFAVMTEDQA